MPLNLAAPQTLCKVIRITGKDSARAHLKDLGIIENEILSVRHSIGGNLIVEVKGVRIALSEMLARRVQVAAL